MITYHVLVGIVTHKKKVLLLERNEVQKFDPERWEFVSRKLKRGEPPTARLAKMQVRYETGLETTYLSPGKKFHVQDEYGMWHIHPFLLESRSDAVRIHPEEHITFKWIQPKDITKYETVAELDRDLKSVGLLE